jgi:hypothetical protein
MWEIKSALVKCQFPIEHEVYEVEPGVVMSAKFASSGLVCEMRVEQTHFDKDIVDLRTGIYGQNQRTSGPTRATLGTRRQRPR